VPLSEWILQNSLQFSDYGEWNAIRKWSLVQFVAFQSSFHLKEITHDTGITDRNAGIR
jgi:hypothetical protein